MIAIFWKEMADHFGRRRFVFLLALVFLAIIWALSVIFGTVEKAASSREEFLFLRVFSSSSDVLPSLLFFISFFGPLAGIILGFDSINSERSQGTLARVLSQPVHRDEVYNGKFLAGLTTLGSHSSIDDTGDCRGYDGFPGDSPGRRRDSPLNRVRHRFDSVPGPVARCLNVVLDIL